MPGFGLTFFRLIPSTPMMPGLWIESASLKGQMQKTGLSCSFLYAAQDLIIKVKFTSAVINIQMDKHVMCGFQRMCTPVCNQRKFDRHQRICNISSVSASLVNRELHSLKSSHFLVFFHNSLLHTHNNGIVLASQSS